DGAAVQPVGGDTLDLAGAKTVVVQNAFGRAGGAGAVDDVERVVESQRHRREFLRCIPHPVLQASPVPVFKVQGDLGLGADVGQSASKAFHLRPVASRAEQEAGIAVV